MCHYCPKFTPQCMKLTLNYYVKYSLSNLKISK